MSQSVDSASESGRSETTRNLASLARLSVGQVLNERYEIRAFLGSGGHAQVFEAFDQTIERSVAIKLLNPHLMARDDDELAVALDRFYREARAAARMRHPNVVTIFDMGVTSTGSEPFIVMELLQGHDLSHELNKNGPMEPARAISLVLRCLDALAEGHRQNIVHKDLKPSNLYLTHPGTLREELVVLDFGIARMLDEEATQTETGGFYGTPRYFAPEYVRSHIATPAADVYQMALILIEMLTARPVVEPGSIYACTVIHIDGKLEVPEAFLEGDFGALLHRALDRDHTKRFADAAEFRATLLKVEPSSIPTGLPPDAPRIEMCKAPSPVPLEAGPVEGDDDDPLAPVVVSPRRRWAVPMASVVVLIVVLVGGWRASQSDSEQNTQADASNTASESAREGSSGKTTTPKGTPERGTKADPLAIPTSVTAGVTDTSKDSEDVVGEAKGDKASKDDGEAVDKEGATVLPVSAAQPKSPAGPKSQPVKETASKPIPKVPARSGVQPSRPKVDVKVPAVKTGDEAAKVPVKELAKDPVKPPEGAEPAKKPTPKVIDHNAFMPTR